MFKTIVVASIVHVLIGFSPLLNATTIHNFVAKPNFHTRLHHSVTYTTPYGLSPAVIRGAYNVPATGGSGTIAIIDAYADSRIQSDLSLFDKTYNITACSAMNGCLTVHPMSRWLSSDAGWDLETSMDVEWAHALAPNARLLLVEARSASGSDLLQAIDYARRQPGVTAVSMSWGGSEFSTEGNYDSYFTSLNGLPITFYASSGDSGNGVQWPAVSSNVTGVGGTSLVFNGPTLTGETAWSGSGGGVSAFVNEPSYQSGYGVSSGGLRGVPDVAFDADPASGASVYDSVSYAGQNGWWQVGGTSLGAPAWAALKADGGTGSNKVYYQDAHNLPASFRDIVNGNNGSCGALCSAHAGYDFVTGLGSPLRTTY